MTNSTRCYGIFCEYDFGFEDQVFATKLGAVNHARSVIEFYHSRGDIEETYEELEEGGLVGWKEMEWFNE